jgi:hypothetical protein
VKLISQPHLSQPDEQNDSAQDDLYPLTGDRPAKSKQKSKTSKMSYEKFLCKLFGLDEPQSRSDRLHSSAIELVHEQAQPRCKLQLSFDNNEASSEIFS